MKGPPKNTLPRINKVLPPWSTIYPLFIHPSSQKNNIFHQKPSTLSYPINISLETHREHPLHFRKPTLHTQIPRIILHTLYILYHHSNAF